MNVVVSAIVDPWVTTLSFVVALAMRIQASCIRLFDRLSDLGVFGYQQKQVVSVTSVVYDPKSAEVLASPVPATTRAAVELFPW